MVVPVYNEQTVVQLLKDKDRLQARLVLTEKMIEAQDKLLVAYRLGRRPSEKTLDELGRLRGALAEGW